MRAPQSQTKIMSSSFTPESSPVVGTSSGPRPVGFLRKALNTPIQMVLSFRRTSNSDQSRTVSPQEGTGRFGLFQSLRRRFGTRHDPEGESVATEMHELDEDVDGNHSDDPESFPEEKGRVDVIPLVERRLGVLNSRLAELERENNTLTDVVSKSPYHTQRYHCLGRRKNSRLSPLPLDTDNGCTHSGHTCSAWLAASTTTFTS